MNTTAQDVRELLALNLTEQDVRYKRVLAALSDEQTQAAAAAYVTLMAYGQEAEDVSAQGGRAAHCVRAAILAGYGMPALKQASQDERLAALEARVSALDPFVDRATAWDVAVAAGQLLQRAPTGTAGTLFSEDVW